MTDPESETKQLNPDLNPHKAAKIAMVLYAERYSRQSLGSMGFWNSLSKEQQKLCREILEQVLSARSEGER